MGASQIVPALLASPFALALAEATTGGNVYEALGSVAAAYLLGWIAGRGKLALLRRDTLARGGETRHASDAFRGERLPGDGSGRRTADDSPPIGR